MESCHKLLGILGTRLDQQHPELVAPQSRHDIGAAHDLQQTPRSRTDQAIASRMSLGIVHLFQIIEIDGNNGTRIAVTIAAGFFTFEQRFPAPPIVKPGEGIEF